MSETDDKQQSEQRPAGVGPGERLQAARIQQGLSLEDVANRMHLSPSILEAIEENNFDEITAPIFVKGYLRAYARIVSLDEDEMIQQYVDFYSEEDPPISSTSNMAPELSVADARIKWTTYLVIVVLAALLAAWWWNKQQDGDPPISLDAPQSETGEAAAGAGNDVISEIEAVSERLDTEALSRSDALASEPEIVAPAPAEDPLETAAAAIDEEPMAPPESEPPAQSEMPVAGSGIDSGVVADAAPEAATPTREQAAEGNLIVAQIAPSGTDKLLVIVNADSWADIKDATGFQLAYDLLRADQQLELIGEAPFSVFLGNGHGVELKINDEEVDLASRIRDDNTARLKIGP